MSHLWSSQRISEKVWSLSHLLSGIRISGQASRSRKIELVTRNGILVSGHWFVASLRRAQPSRSKKQETRSQKPVTSYQIIGDNNGGK